MLIEASYSTLIKDALDSSRRASEALDGSNLGRAGNEIKEAMLAVDSALYWGAPSSRSADTAVLQAVSGHLKWAKGSIDSGSPRAASYLSDAVSGLGEIRSSMLTKRISIGAGIGAALAAVVAVSALTGSDD